MNIPMYHSVTLQGPQGSEDIEAVRGYCDPCPECGNSRDVVSVWSDSAPSRGVSWCPCGTVVARTGERGVKVIHQF